MNFKNIHQSKLIQGIIIGIIAMIAFLFVFALGVIVGSHKAQFEGNFGDKFERNFRDGGMPRIGEFGFGGDLEMGPNSHGAVGQILTIDSSKMVITGPDNLEKIVLIKSDTLVREFRDEKTLQDLKVGSFVVIIGTPNTQGEIEAKLIRIMPPPPDADFINQATTTKK